MDSKPKNNLKVLLVTSQITYMPDNYLPLFKELLNTGLRPSGLILLKNLDRKTMKSILGLFFWGAYNVGKTLLRNIRELPQKKREKLFQSYHIPVLKWKTMNDPKVIEWVREQNIDIILNLRTRCIYKNPILTVPKIACLNVHHGLLPKYRGTLCDLYALSESRPAGFTIHQMNQKIDAGKILRIKEVNSGKEKNYLNYLSQTVDAEAQEIMDLLKDIDQLGSLPKGIPNKSEKKVFTRNPTRQQVKQFISQGMIL